MLEVWDLWFPDAGATGIAFARSRVDDQRPKTGCWSMPPTHPRGRRARPGRQADRPRPGAGTRPIRADELPGPPERQHPAGDGWPTLEDLGRLVILPGGEAGILQA
jgi:hypothetical protein